MNLSLALPGITRPLTLAVLVDGENIQPDQARPALDRATQGHSMPIRRVYGCPTQARVWAEGHGFHGIFTPKIGAKNAADIALVIDAMELALRNRAEGFVLVTSDSDFTRLATWLRENGFPVFGIGAAQTPVRFRLACTGFYLAATVTKPLLDSSKAGALAVVQTESAPTIPENPSPPNARPPVAPGQNPTMSRALVERLRRCGGRALLSQINPMMRDALDGLLISQTPYRGWRAFLEAHPNACRITGTGPDTMVELVQGRPAS